MHHLASPHAWILTMDFNSDLLLIRIFYAKFLLRFDTKTDWKILRLKRVFVKIEIEILDGFFFCIYSFHSGQCIYGIYENILHIV